MRTGAAIVAWLGCDDSPIWLTGELDLQGELAPAVSVGNGDFEVVHSAVPSELVAIVDVPDGVRGVEPEPVAPSASPFEAREVDTVFEPFFENAEPRRPIARVKALGDGLEENASPIADLERPRPPAGLGGPGHGPTTAGRRARRQVFRAADGLGTGWKMDLDRERWKTLAAAGLEPQRLARLVGAVAPPIRVEGAIPIAEIIDPQPIPSRRDPGRELPV